MFTTIWLDCGETWVCHNLVAAPLAAPTTPALAPLARMGANASRHDCVFLTLPEIFFSVRRSVDRELIFSSIKY